MGTCLLQSNLLFWRLTGERPLPPPLARWPTTSEPRCLAHRYVDLVLAAAVAEQRRPLLRQVTAMAHRQTSQNAHAPLTRPQHPPPTARGAALAQAGAGAVAAARQPLPLHLTPPAGESYPIILGIAGRCRAAGRVRRTAPDDARCPTLSGCPCAPRIGACTEGIALAEPSAGAAPRMPAPDAAFAALPCHPQPNRSDHLAVTLSG